MIYWINGAYGVGKSTFAEYLHKKNPNSFIFDAEAVGNAVRENMPKELFNGYIFEGYELWFKTIVNLLIEITSKYDGDIYVPMTLVYPDSFAKIKIPLEDKGLKVKHILLVSNYQTVHDRILKRGETEDCWCMQNIELCLNNQKEFVDVIRIESIDKDLEALSKELEKILLNSEHMIKDVKHEHIALRKAKMSDLEAIYQNVWSSKEVAKYLFWKESESLEEAKERLKRTINFQSHHHGFVVVLKKTDEVIGVTGLYEYEPFKYMESGLCLGEKYQGFGYGKEMLEMLLYLAFEVFKANIFRYSCITENVRSKNLCLKYGFEYSNSKSEIRKWDNKEFTIDYFYLTKDKYFEKIIVKGGM